MNPNSSKVMRELTAYIEQAWGHGTEGASVRHDPALARNLEWIRDCYEALYKDADNSFNEDDV